LVLWKCLWASGEASQWRAVDAAAVTRLVELESIPAGEIDVRLLAEVRQLEDRFGLNPYARRQLGWRAPAEVEDRPEVAPGRSGSRRGDALRVITGGTA